MSSITQNFLNSWLRRGRMTVVAIVLYSLLSLGYSRPVDASAYTSAEASYLPSTQRRRGRLSDGKLLA